MIIALSLLGAACSSSSVPVPRDAERRSMAVHGTSDTRLLLTGDVMLGRGVDQFMPRSADPVLYESYIRSAEGYVTLAETKSDPIPRDVAPKYVWGDLLPVLDAYEPAARVVNLETAVTTWDEPWPGKGIHYRMHPGNVDVLAAAGVHWGGNWGYGVPGEHERFAKTLLDEGGVDLIHGHSSHHPKGIEVPGGRLILYGAGDLINDYEGIGGYESFRPELTLAYLPRLDPSGRLESMVLVPLRVERFRLQRAAPEEVAWLRDLLERESRGGSFRGDGGGVDFGLSRRLRNPGLTPWATR